MFISKLCIQNLWYIYRQDICLRTKVDFHSPSLTLYHLKICNQYPTKMRIKSGPYLYWKSANRALNMVLFWCFGANVQRERDYFLKNLYSINIEYFIIKKYWNRFWKAKILRTREIIPPIFKIVLRAPRPWLMLLTKFAPNNTIRRCCFCLNLIYFEKFYNICDISYNLKISLPTRKIQLSIKMCQIKIFCKQQIIYVLNFLIKLILII